MELEPGKISLGICCNVTLAHDFSPEFPRETVDFIGNFVQKAAWFSGSIYILHKPGSMFSADIKRALVEKAAVSELRVEMLQISGDGMGSILSCLSEIDRPGESGIFHFWADSAFLNHEVNSEVLDLHLKYFSDYVFAEGYPGGIAGEILSNELISSLASGENLPGLQRNGIFESVKPVINSWDVETAVSPEDLRMYRLELFRDRKRNIRIVEALKAFISPDQSARELCDVIMEKKEAYRSLPAFFAMQITARCPQSCAYCPYPLTNPGHLSDQRYVKTHEFETMLDKICAFVDDPVISLSVWGEPFLNPEIESILKAAADAPAGCRFLMETSGIGWNDASKKALSAFPPGRLELIVSLDSIDPDLYERLRGPGFREAMEFIDWAAPVFGDHLYVQAVRMNENEDHLLRFHRHWKDKGIKFIIQKYSDHGGLIPGRQVADLSPLKRHECWHVKRDLLIDLNGECFSCSPHSVRKNKDFSLGNLLTDDIDKIWARGEKLYSSHLNGALPEICVKCDEWYSFNF